MIEKLKAWLDGLGWWKYVIAAATIYAATVSAVAVALHSITKNFGWHINLSVFKLLGIAAAMDILIALCLYDKYGNVFTGGDQESITHGSAEFMRPAEIAKTYTVAKPQEGHGIPVGYKQGTKDVVHIDPGIYSNENILIVGESGRGKTRGLMIPAILECSRHGDSMVITDPKGELYANLAATLHMQGYKVYRLIFNLQDMRFGNRFNPLDKAFGDGSGIYLREQVDMLYSASSIDKSDPFWNSTSKNLLMAIIGYLQATISKPSYGDVLDFVQDYSLEDIRYLFNNLPNEKRFYQARCNWNLVSSADDKVLSSIKIQMSTALSMFTEDSVRAITACSDFSPDIVAREKAAIFVITDSGSSTYDALTSMLLGSCFREVIRYQDNVIANGGTPRKVRFMLDELANIAKIQDIEMKLNTCRSRLVSVIAACQTIGQLKHIASDPQRYEELIGAFSYSIVLGSSDLETMNYFSSMAGESTVTDTAHDSSGAVRYTYTSRELIKPEEIRRIPRNELILFHSGAQPLRLTKLNFNDFVAGRLMKMDYRRRPPHSIGNDGNAPTSPNRPHKPTDSDDDTFSKPRF